MRLSIESYERMAGEILKIYEQAEMEMLRRVNNRLQRGIDQPGWTEKKYSEMKQVTKQMTKVVASLHRDVSLQTQQYVETGYEDGRESFINEAREFTDMVGVRELTPTAIKVANILGDLDMSLSAADRLILRQVNDEYANVIAEAAAMIATGTYTNRQAVQAAVNRFADKGIKGFVDKAGRHWDMTTYAEMATLTAIERATRQGYTDTMQEFGFDLAIISSHYGACPLCEAWENVVISVSGKDTRYPSLADAEAGGCFHPRCLHVFSTYYEGITKGGRKGPRAVTAPNIGYSVRSQQRAYERAERRWKRRMEVAQTPEQERAAYARVRMYQERIRGLVNEYNATQDSSVDYLHRQWYREGGKVQLSTAAAKLKPVTIPLGNQAKSVSIAGEGIKAKELVQPQITQTNNLSRIKQIEYRETNDSKLKYILDTVKLPRDKAEDAAKVLFGYNADADHCYFNGDDSVIRAGKTEDAREKGKILQEYVNASPKYEGKIYRGMAIQDELLDKLQIGTEFDEKQYMVSSWSSREDVGQRYANVNARERGGTRVVFEYSDPKHGCPVACISLYETEQEVLVNNEQVKYRIVGREEYTKGKPGSERTYVKILLEEIE